VLMQLAEWLAPAVSGFNLFQYITFRGVMAAITAMLISLALGPPVIAVLKRMKVGQSIRREGPSSHYSKSGTPTMGGVLMILTIVLTTLLWADISNRYIAAALLTTLAFAAIGGADDYLKLRRNGRGLTIGGKFFWQAAAGLALAVMVFNGASRPEELQLIVPFVKDVVVDMGPWFVLLAWLTVVGASNAVNLTDGLDGLVVLPAALIAVALSIFAYTSGHVNFAQYLAMPHLPQAGELVIFCGALAGAALGFLWFNTYPAQVFMGDVGALSLGAAIGMVAVLVRQELVLVIMGGVFVIETLSVIIQVASFKSTGRRIFRMAPLHHHFELRGWPEPRVIVRFWIVSLLLVLVGLATLKIR